jgi:dimethylaniline monooxygenase (N-oxide forming)
MRIKKVAIIGAGRSGLVSAKYALENGLEPHVFERSGEIGGLWAKNTAIWEGLYSNISIYAMMFSDHPWPDGSSIFASKQEVHDYLMSYANRFDLNKHIQLNTRVHKVVKLPNNQWEVKYTNSTYSLTDTLVFDFLIIASGLHYTPREVTFKNQALFQGRVVHSSAFDFNDPVKYIDKKVVIVGFGFSAIDAAVNLADKAKTVINVFSRPYLISHRLTNYKLTENSFKMAPVDVFFNNPLFIHGFKEPVSDNISSNELRQLRANALKNIFPKQTNKELAHPALYIDVDDEKNEFLLNFSDHYLDLVEANKIIPRRARIQEMTKDGIVLDDGSFESADVIVLCTGYDLSLEILEESVVDLFKHENEQNFRFKLLAYKYTFHPEVENLALVNKIEGLTIVGDELQAKWISLVFSGKLALDKDKMREEIRAIKEMISSSNQRKVQYPYGGAREQCKNIAIELGCDKLPSIDHLRISNPGAYEVFSKSIFPPANYFYLNNEKNSEALASAIANLWQVDHVFDNADNLSSQDFARKFHERFSYQKIF